MNHGLIVGLILVGLAFIIYLLKIKAGGLFQYLNWAVIIAAVYYSMKAWRDQYCGGYITYAKALGYGIRVMFFASIVYGFYSMLYMTWINPDAMEETLSAVEEGYYVMGFDDQQIEQLMEFAERMRAPGWQVFTSVLGMTFTGLIISLIVAIFVKREGDPFQSAMGQVQDNQLEDNQ